MTIPLRAQKPPTLLLLTPLLLTLCLGAACRPVAAPNPPHARAPAQLPSAKAGDAPPTQSGAALLTPAPGLPPESLVARDATRTWQALLPWGDAPLQVGHSAPAEGNPEAPSSFAVTQDGRIWLLDQLNQRVLVLRMGANGMLEQALPPIPASLTTQDLAVAPDGERIFTVDRLVERNLLVRTLHEPLAFGSVSLRLDSLPDSGGITGIFPRTDGVWLEYEHADLQRVATLAGVHATRLTLHGRPLRDGQSVLRAQKVPPNQVILSAHQAAGAEKSAAIWSASLTFAAPVLAIAGVDVAPDGSAWITADLARFDADGAPSGLARTAVVVDAEGHEAQRVELLVPEGPEEQLRTTTVGADGAFYAMARSPAGLHLERWAR